MLRQRVITASVMMLVFLGLLFLSPWHVFLSFASLIFIVGAWEWSNLAGFKSLYMRVCYVLALLSISFLLLYFSSIGTNTLVLKWVLFVACLWWILAFVWVRLYPMGESLVCSQNVRALMGIFVLLPAWMSVVFLIQHEDGPLLVLLGLLIVAAVDVGAYFSGRRFGKRKLAPVVSPGKSWEGVWGGLALALFVGIGFVGFFGSLELAKLLVVILPAALISVVGDLLESMVKRVRGVKDSGTLLPGHGGVLDRIDGLTSAIPVFSAAILLTNWAL